MDLLEIPAKANGIRFGIVHIAIGSGSDAGFCIERKNA
jgi:hypothetical protein